MEKFESILTIINIILTIISSVGAYKSIKYFRKSRNLTIYAQTNKALVEVQYMLNKLPEVLVAFNMEKRAKKGFSLQNTLSNVGQELNSSLAKIVVCVSPDHSKKLRNLQNIERFNLQKYINSCISGEIIKESGLDTEAYDLCQESLINIQDYLKGVVYEIEEKLK